ncbi:hypothetical protein A3D14_02330 [Candidatus Saccharibacteria bacterium RIFCSPHIGHO2_02_FULL_47_12]|nr:MAG: hypothetical protein A3D14_02330 [Candidatus Saccharibacteria bacterium RIFCSPHIGHO2_02_FULL_47_12]
MKKVPCGEAWITSSEKRRNDVLIAASLSPIISTLGIISAAAMFIEDGQGPIFQQKRIGQDGNPFNLFKLRTMNSSQFVDASYGVDDPRATRVGKILRKLTLDEFPQAINILKGEMSVVGPRPLLQADIDAMKSALSPSDYSDWFYAYSVGRPGWLSQFGNLSHSLEAQTEGYYTERAELDVQYLELASPEFDRQIIKEAVSVGLGLIS